MIKKLLLFFSFFANSFFINKIKSDNNSKINGVVLCKFNVKVNKNLYFGPVFGSGVDSIALLGFSFFLDRSLFIIDYFSINYIYFLEVNKHSISLDFITKYFVIVQIIFIKDCLLFSVGLTFIEKYFSKKAIFTVNVSFVVKIMYENDEDNDSQINLTNKEEMKIFKVSSSSNAQERQFANATSNNAQERQFVNVTSNVQERQVANVIKENFIRINQNYFKLSTNFIIMSYLNLNAILLTTNYFSIIVVPSYFLLDIIIGNAMFSYFCNKDKRLKIFNILYDKSNNIYISLVENNLINNNPTKYIFKTFLIQFNYIGYCISTEVHFIKKLYYKFKSFNSQETQIVNITDSNAQETQVANVIKENFIKINQNYFKLSTNFIIMSYLNLNAILLTTNYLLKPIFSMYYLLGIFFLNAIFCYFFNIDERLKIFNIIYDIIRYNKLFN